MSIFKKSVLEPLRLGQKEGIKGIPIPLIKLSKITNYIEKGQVVTIGGKATSGKASFMDFVYLMSIFKWWRDLGHDEEGKSIDNPNQPKLKIFYFNMKNSEKIKYQKWLCLYLKMYHNIVIDIPTLTNSVGKLYDLTSDEITKINAAKEFFNDMEDVMSLVNGSQQPSSIYNRVHNYMEDIGTIDDNGNYYLNEENPNQITILFIENTDCLLPESEGFQNLNSEALNKKLSEYLNKLKTVYNVNSFVVVPSRVNNSRMIRDSEPTYKELGVFGKNCDLGLIIYNPFNENNNKYLGYPIEELVVSGKNRFRTVTVVRNSQGLENITVGTIFLGECGYFAESPLPTDENGFYELIDNLNSLP